MQLYCESLTAYHRLKTLEVKIGDLLLGNNHPIRVQTMTTTDTMDTLATVEQTIRCIEAGAEMVRITAPSKKEAENLLHIKNELRRRGYSTPLIADIHFTPNAAEIAARIIEKVRVNPGNYVDKKNSNTLNTPMPITLKKSIVSANDSHRWSGSVKPMARPCVSAPIMVP